MSIKPYYIDEVKETVSKMNAEKGDFKFAVVADSHLDNSLCDTLANISEVDKAVSFDCMLHLGDFLNGNIPSKFSEKAFREQIDLFKNSIKGDFYPTQGNHDGYVDNEGFGCTDMATDELWTAATGLEKPYYFVDIEDKKIRLISICSFYYEYNEEGRFCKKYAISPVQVEWVKNEALKLEKDWTVILFSHDVPFKSLKNSLIQDTSKLQGRELLDEVLKAREKYGFHIAAWFIGHFHGDYIGKICGINFILVASETAYVPQLWGMDEETVETYPERKLKTVTEDAWDAVVLDKESRMLKLFRFGAGSDRQIDY